MYGRMPPRPSRDQITVVKMRSQSVCDDAGIEEQFTLTISRRGKSASLAFAVIRPREKRRYPSIIKNCRALFDDTGIRKRFQSLVAHDFAAAREAVKRGYVLCKFRREDLAPDHPDNRQKGVFLLYPQSDWGTIAVWAWTHQVVLDALDELGYANMNQIVYTGHSRGGQTAIAAGIFDERAAIVVPCTGGFGSCATLRVRDPDGVRGTLHYIGHLKGKNPHWFHPRYFEFSHQQNRLPFDAHTLVALVAPRPFLNTNATEDQNNNTLAIEAGIRTGRQVYKWMQLEDRCRLHWRPGQHAQQHEDWLALFDFADEVFFGRKGTSVFNKWVYPDFKPDLHWSVPSR